MVDQAVISSSDNENQKHGHKIEAMKRCRCVSGLDSAILQILNKRGICTIVMSG